MSDQVREAKPCPDGQVRHTLFVALDCSICHPECHDRCGCEVR